MKATEALAKGFNLTLGSTALLGILFGVNLVITGMATAVIGTNPPQAAEDAATVLGKIAILLPILLLAGIFLQGAILGVYRDKIKTNNLALNMFMPYGGKYYLRLLGLGLLIVLIQGLVGITGIGLAALLGSIGGGTNVFLGILAGIIMLVTFIALIIFGLPLVYSGYILVADEAGIIAAIKKSFSFVKTYWGRVLCLFLLLVLFALGLQLIAGLIQALFGKINVQILTTTVMLILNSAINSFVSILMVATLMSLYLGLTAQPQTATTGEENKGQKI